jgi:hypothetical protein
MWGASTSYLSLGGEFVVMKGNTEAGHGLYIWEKLEMKWAGRNSTMPRMTDRSK